MAKGKKQGRAGGERVNAALRKALEAVERQYDGVVVDFKRWGPDSPHVPTGCCVVDRIIGPVGGFPVGPTMLYSLEGVGKTTLAIHAAIENQRRGGVTLYVDFENKFNLGYAKDLGLDVSKLKETGLGGFIYLQPKCMEEGWQIAVDLVKAGGVNFVVMDSIPTMVPRKIVEAEIEDQVKVVGLHPRLLAGGLKVLVPELRRRDVALLMINQLRANLKAVSPWDPRYTLPGGMAPPYNSLLILELTVRETVRREQNNPITGERKKMVVGQRVAVRAVKNQVGNVPFLEGWYYQGAGTGVDNAYTAAELGLKNGVIKEASGGYEFGEYECEGTRADLVISLRADPEAIQWVYEAVWSSLVEKTAPTALVPMEGDEEVAVTKIEDAGEEM